MQATIKMNRATQGHGKVLQDKGYEVKEDGGKYVIECNEVVDGNFDNIEAFTAAIKEGIPKKRLFSYKTKVGGIQGLALCARLSSKKVGGRVLTAFIVAPPKEEKKAVEQKSLEDFSI